MTGRSRVTKTDHRKVARIILAAVGPHECLLEAREHGLRVDKARDEAIELCIPTAHHFVEALYHASPASRIERDDIRQAAMIAVIRGVDVYRPRNPDGAIITTFLWYKIRKAIQREVQNTHWATMKPPQAMVERYMSRDMEEDEREQYDAIFIGRTLEESDYERSM